jgi:hypothetical protein
MARARLAKPSKRVEQPEEFPAGMENQEPPGSDPYASPGAKPLAEYFQAANDNRPSISKAEAVRQALSLGLDSLDDIAGFLKSRHGIEMPRPQISAYKAQAKRKAEGQSLNS